MFGGLLSELLCYMSGPVTYNAKVANSLALPTTDNNDIDNDTSTESATFTKLPN